MAPPEDQRERLIMLAESDKINGLPIRAEIRIPRDGDTARWLSSVVVCQSVMEGVPASFVVWSVFANGATVYAENGIYDIADYGRALGKAMARAAGRPAPAPSAPEHNCVLGDECPY